MIAEFLNIQKHMVETLSGSSRKDWNGKWKTETRKFYKGTKLVLEETIQCVYYKGRIERR